MIPYYQQPSLQTHRQPQQSQGFQPTQPRPRPQQTLYAQAAQPPAAAFSQPYQTYSQYRQSGPAQYFTQQPSQPFAPQRRYAPQSGLQSAPQPHSVAVHQASAPYRPSQPSQLRNTQAHIQSYPSTPSFSYTQPRSGPVIPPARANSQSPDKGRRPLPDPSVTSGVTRQRPTSMPPTSTPVLGVQVQSQSAYPSASSVPQMPASSSQTQPFHNQSQHQPPRAPLQSYEPALHTQTIPNSVQSAQASSTHTVESTASKRPLPAPPGKAVPSPSSQPVTPSHSKMSPAATPAASRRTLPFSPTQSPSIVEGMKARKGSFSTSAQGSPLSTASDDTIRGQGSGAAKDSYDAAEGPIIRISRQTIPPAAPNSQSSSFSSPAAQPASAAPTSRLPPREQGSKSLAFRLASLSLHEEQTHKQPAKRPFPVENRTAFKPNSASPLARSHGRSVIDLDDISPPPPSIRLQSFEKPSIVRSRPTVPTIVLPGEDEDDDDEDDDDEEDDDDDDEEEEEEDEDEDEGLQSSANGLVQRRRGLICYGCDRGIIGRIVSAMGGRWHPACFKCVTFPQNHFVTDATSF